MPSDTDALKKAAWDEYRTGLDLVGQLPATLRAERQPSAHFVAVELGFAPEQRPSLLDTMAGIRRSELDALAENTRLQARGVLTAKQARRALRAITRRTSSFRQK